MSRALSLGIIGDYEPERLSHRAVSAALDHTADYLSVKLDVRWLPTESLLEPEYHEILGQFTALWGAPGSYRSQDGAINGIRYAREMNRPFLGT